MSRPQALIGLRLLMPAALIGHFSRPRPAPAFGEFSLWPASLHQAGGSPRCPLPQMKVALVG
jgi:hypothetical protein